MIQRQFFCFIAWGLLLAGCRHTSEVIGPEREAAFAPVLYSITYYIHGDGDYLFHDNDGRAVYADESALLKAVEVAEGAVSGEIFIIHHQPDKRWLGIFPRRNSSLFHFRNGEKKSRISYRHQSRDEAFLQTESELIKKLRTDKNQEQLQRFFLYFGHEIPLKNGTGYHSTLPKIEVNTGRFSSGIQQLLLHSRDTFDLVVLSTCSNGTPAMAKSLQPFTDYLLASPQNLHLSYMDTRDLRLLEEPDRPPVSVIAETLAQNTFERLRESVQTVLTLSLYDLSQTADYLDELDRLISEYERDHNPNPHRDNIDCAELPFFDSEKYTAGIKTLYNPPRFGRQTSVKKHSGWGCKAL